MTVETSKGQKHDPQDTAYKPPKETDATVLQSETPTSMKDILKGLTDEEVKASRDKHGSNEIKAAQTPEWKKILKRYTCDWIVVLMFIAAIVGVAVKNDGDRGYTSFVLLILELNLVVWVGYYSDRNAGNAVKELEELAAPTALVRRNNAWQELNVKELVVGDLIQLKGGDVIPADAKLVGNSEPIKVDEASLTGESLAVNKGPGAAVLSGAVVEQGESEATVTAVGANTFFGRTITLLSRPEEKGHLQQVLGRVQLILAVISFIMVIIILAVLLSRGDGVGYSIVISIVVLVSVVPIGMPVVTTTVLAVGAREMAKEKALVNRLSALEELSGVEILASDKTGTLTLNKLSLDKKDIVAAPGKTAEEVLLYASLSARWENADAIDTAITSAVDDPKHAHAYDIQRIIPFSPVDKRTTAWVVSPEGKKFVTTKGAPQIIAGLLGEEEAAQTMDYIDERASRGLRALAVANSEDDGATWTLAGLISMLDPPRPDSADTIKEAQSLGVEVKMITGDNLQIGVETAKRLGMGTRFMEGKELMRGDLSSVQLGEKIVAENIDGFAGVYPEHKFALVQAMQAKGMLIGMTGDGVNDAPALKAANVGIAVAGATPAAQGAADIILTQEGISTIITAINRSRKIFRRIETYIIYRISSSFTILGFFFFAMICMNFVIPTWVLILLSITNDLSSMAVSLDKVYSSDLPLLFDMTKCLTVALAMSLVGITGCLLLLGLASFDRLNWWPAWGIDITPDNSGPFITDGQVVAVIYIALTIIIQMNIIATRNPSFWFYFSKQTAPPPSWKLAVPISLFLLGSTFIAVYWPATVKPDGGKGFMDGIGWAAIMLTWFYSLLWFSLADAAKALLQWIFRKHTEVEIAVKEHGAVRPWWATLINGPSRFSTAAKKSMDKSIMSLKPKKSASGADSADEEEEKVENPAELTLSVTSPNPSVLSRESNTMRAASMTGGSRMTV